MALLSHLCCEGGGSVGVANVVVVVVVVGVTVVLKILRF